MATVTTLTKSLAQHCMKKSKACWHKPSQPLVNLLISEENLNQFHQYQSRRTLILESASSELVKLQRLSDSDSGIIEVSLNRPGARNAIGTELLRGLKHKFETISEDSSAKVVMISSSVPKVFCAGADLKERRAMSASEIHFFVNSLRSTFSFLEALPVPTIAVIEGAALGGGLEMALACDLRVCGEDAVLGLPETGLAIIPGAGGTQRLPRLVGRSVAKDLIFTGRKVGGRDAMSIGLVNFCVPAGQAQLKALEIAREINQKGPIAIRMAKRAISEGPEIDMASALQLEEECYLETLDTKDRLEGLAAFAEKRKPRYTGI
ncbi:probable enoyl-CoA hydratase 2, mitochondrial [Pistacia vera]|uniref:probable enoyl-CoA hydratase 2, mitochondrial n=1 Tax=Pistacia vera TaxID=55513 RepID=UPI001262E70C|nr:probable enoyl-CoA hydratase 2, mitochondrial [Pistacia vera]XP_031287077.1 probable enoyl-CoA hydratase 2, mitochondrial [Pistacia vera]